MSKPERQISAEDRKELDKAAEFIRLVRDCVACGVPLSEAQDKMYEDVYLEDE